MCLPPLSVPIPASVTIISDQANPINAGSTVRVTCTVELSPAVVDSDLSAIVVDTQLSRDGTPLTVTHLTVADTIFTYTIQLDSYGWNDSGNYTCTATVRPQPHSTFLITTESSESSDTVRVTAGSRDFTEMCGLYSLLCPLQAYTFLLEVGIMVIIATFSSLILEREMMELCSASLTSSSAVVAVIIWGSGIFPVNRVFKLVQLVVTSIETEVLVWYV